jgi:hypothetical protein
MFLLLLGGGVDFETIFTEYKGKVTNFQNEEVIDLNDIHI